MGQEAVKKIIYSMSKLSKKIGDRFVLKDISLSYFYGAKIGVLGLNGAGKSTLLRIMAGLDKDFQGEVHVKESYSVGLLEQEPQLDASKTVRQVVQEGVQDVVELLERFERINASFGEALDAQQMEDLLKEQGKVQDLLDAKDAWTLDDRLNFAMAALSCPPADRLVEGLSGGEKRRVALCRLLIQEPGILLLDEPTNHLDAGAVHWLEQHLAQYPGTVIAVTHDRYFLDNVAGWILELDRGSGIPYKGNYSSWLEQKQRRHALEERSQLKKNKFLEKELEWVRMTPSARQAKGKARLRAYENMLTQKQDALVKDLKIYIPPGPRLGSKVLEVKALSKSHGDKLLFKDLNFSLPAGAILGVVGANGLGKSSLFRIICGLERADGGSFSLGSTVKLAHMEQSRESLDSRLLVQYLMTTAMLNFQPKKSENIYRVLKTVFPLRQD